MDDVKRNYISDVRERLMLLRRQLEAAGKDVGIEIEKIRE